MSQNLPNPFTLTPCRQTGRPDASHFGKGIWKGNQGSLPFFISWEFPTPAAPKY